MNLTISSGTLKPRCAGTPWWRGRTGRPQLSDRACQPLLRGRNHSRSPGLLTWQDTTHVSADHARRRAPRRV